MEIMSMESPQDKDNTSGVLQEVYMKDNFKKVLSMVKESGERIKIKQYVIDIQGIINLIKSMGMGNLNGCQETYIRVIM